MFQNSDDIQILTVPREPRRYLILIRAGSKRRPSLFSEPLSERREYDVGINYYADPHPDDAFRTGAELIFGGGLSKMHGAKRLFEATGLHNIYEGVFFWTMTLKFYLIQLIFSNFAKNIHWISRNRLSPLTVPVSSRLRAITLV
ncbi:hypothetical protein [Mesorhizobium huakuii]|uniref:Uncharacterized protein n=1 Tax=Mesorhizobium huakuii TaxID=28104 RepID=A0A7G6T1C9_9HYPH|nr:hypothetical protein [Mesorhizobium huakuii]QND60561.1 hypothetical protein HB778_31490 [Mesorhizobium huakuii]